MTPLDDAPVLTVRQMRAAEDAAIARGASVSTLMDRAGAAVGEQVRRLAAGGEILVLCGPGNNGGDGYIAAAVLAQAGSTVRVAAAGEPRREEARAAAATWKGPVEPLDAAAAAPIMVDALFGTGLSRGLDAAAAGALARLSAGARLTIAVDVPSGVATDDGTLLSPVPRFDVTFALGALKPAHLLHPAAERCGALRLLDIGVMAADGARVLARPVLRAPDAADHKYSRGMVAVVAGAMPGAAALAAEAAARSGAGYVLLLGSATDRLPHAIVRRRYAADALTDRRISALLVGPGLGRDARAQARVEDALAAPYPLVLDGDALHLVTPARLTTRVAPTVLTPHAGEFAALFGDLGGSRIEQAQAAARLTEAVVVLKGADTVIAHPDGRVRIAPDAPTWLSTAGTGDVLAGTIAARLTRDDGFAAACAGVWLHREGARRAGPSFLADDLLRYLPSAIAQCL